MKSIKKFFSKRTNLAVWLVAAFLMLVMFLTAFLASKGAFGVPGDSAIVDEVAHIPAGYSYDKYLDYRMNPEHPPLAKALAGLPLALDKNIKGFKTDWTWDSIDQWDAGWYFLYHAGNDPAQMLLWARIPMMLLMVGLGFFLFKWAKEAFGPVVGLIVLALYALYPDVLAHGKLVTTDVPAALGFVISTYFFSDAVDKKTWKSTIWGGLAFALAQLLKFSAFLLYGVFLILVVIKAIMERKEAGFWPAFWSRFKTYFWICAISLVVVWAVYTPFTWNTPPAIEHKLIETNLTQDPRTIPLRNFEHHFENSRITRGLGHYLLGILLVIGRVEGGNNTFILGHLSNKSISWYFPVAWLLKTPLPVIILSLWSIVNLFLFWPDDKKKKWFLAVILTPVIVYWAVTLKGQLDIGIRHLMPTVPFVLLLIGYNIALLFSSKKLWPKVVVGILLAYMAVSTYSNYPCFISYFNEMTPKDVRYTRLIDSSLDWGQDLLRLKGYIDDNNIKTIKVDYFGGSVPSYYIPQSTEWHSAYGPTTGWLAVSATFYQSSKLTGKQEGQWSYSWLDSQKPKAIIGGSILVFDITSADLKAHPPTSPYVIKTVAAPQQH